MGRPGKWDMTGRTSMRCRTGLSAFRDMISGVTDCFAGNYESIMEGHLYQRTFYRYGCGAVDGSAGDIACGMRSAPDPS